ncbi:MAG: ATP-binding protein [Desulfarculus sp.]|nr:ATP-binding protein [Desulfarculus sp.]
MSAPDRKLYLNFHGRIIDHLGIQMYQSPVAAIAELISNSWDADAELVEVTLPDSMDTGATYIIKDNGIGMTFEECQRRFLNVGYCRRGGTPTERTLGKERPVLGRKGIGKFAGFGIAKSIDILTISKETGEKTVFQMDLDDLRAEEYRGERREVPVIEASGPDEATKAEHGTTVILRELVGSRRPNKDQFAKSMARRFLLAQTSSDFKITINGEDLPRDDYLENAAFVFPEEYTVQERPEGLVVTNGWGVESLSDGQAVSWRIAFRNETIKEEAFRGISIFANGKLAQSPFMFNLTGGLFGQVGQEYLVGQVKADYIDGLAQDIIAPERQRINWELTEAAPLLEWGQNKIKELLTLWKNRRSAQREAVLDGKVGGFDQWLNRLQPVEKSTAKKVLRKLAAVDELAEDQFIDLGQALLKSWDQGRLRVLLEKLDQAEVLNPAELISLMLEGDILSALSLLEMVDLKQKEFSLLEKYINDRMLENSLRDYLAAKPYLLHPRWQTYRKEVAVAHLLKKAANDSGLLAEPYNGRIDLALRSDSQLLIVEFMRPGLTLDVDHLQRCQRYVLTAATDIRANTDLGINNISGLVVADNVAKHRVAEALIYSLLNDNITVRDWQSLISEARSSWGELMEVVAERHPDDVRFKERAATSG